MTTEVEAPRALCAFEGCDRWAGPERPKHAKGTPYCTAHNRQRGTLGLMYALPPKGSSRNRYNKTTPQSGALTSVCPEGGAHHFVIEPPSGPVDALIGVCRKCGASKAHRPPELYDLSSQVPIRLDSDPRNREYHSTAEGAYTRSAARR